MDKGLPGRKWPNLSCFPRWEILVHIFSPWRPPLQICYERGLKDNWAILPPSLTSSPLRCKIKDRNTDNILLRGSNDEEANEHLDIGHNLYLLTLNNRLFLAPIDHNPSNILDLGTGTGIWAIDVADLYPSALVIGTDLSPIQ